VTATGPVIVEVNPRLAGGMITRLADEATGVDMIWHVVAEAAGQGRPPQPLKARAASIRFLLATQAGRLTRIDGLHAARHLPGVVEVGLTCEIGQEIMIRQSFRDRLGYVIAAGDDHASAARAAEAGLQALTARISPVLVTAEASR
jgi:S-sulfo-L-cysteine synthase (3-phospho-L-serine-dependent)